MEGFIDMANKHVLPKHFEWLYAYIGKDSGKVGYVGRSKNIKRCAIRLCEHKRDPWYSSEEWEWAFWPCLNRYESETLETIFINRYDPKWNKDKKGWGLPYDGPTIEMMSKADEKLLDTIDMVSYMLDIYEQQLRDAMLDSGDWKEAES